MNKGLFNGAAHAAKTSGHLLEECPKPKSWTKRFQEKPKGYKKTLVNPSSKQLVNAGLASKEPIIVLSEPNR